MKKLALALLILALAGCGERVDFKTVSVTCNLTSETDTQATFKCSDGTSVTLDKPERTVEVVVEVPISCERCKDGYEWDEEKQKCKKKKHHDDESSEDDGDSDEDDDDESSEGDH